jgi:hypothetical protein
LPEVEYGIGGKVCSGADAQAAASGGGTFMKTRRTFLGGMLFAGAATGLAGSLTLSQPQEFPRKPQPVQEPPPDWDTLPSPERRMREDNNMDTRKKVERLYQLATELKAEVDKTDSTKVLSLNLVKKVEEIEKLAHDIKHRSKG